MKRSELLMPAGNLEKLKIAVLYGADAIYMGTPDMSLRTKAEFTLEQVVEGIEFAHAYGKRVYLTLNLFSHNKDVPKLAEYAETIREISPDGLIIADPGVFQYMKEAVPHIPLHISTQSNVCSWLTVKFWEAQGAELCVMAREVSFPELVEIREKCPDIKLEAFIHGAMCMTYSGRCLLSNFMSERGANQGNCANSCRWHYKLHIRLKDGKIHELPITDENKELFEFLLEEDQRPGELMPIEEDDRGSYILNSKDMCMMPVLDDYLRLGVDSLKVEGRGKSPYYVALVARTYRAAIDAWYADPESWDPKPYLDELRNVQNRGYTMAFHNGRLTNYAHNYEDTQAVGEWEFAGIISEVREDAFVMQVKNRILAGDVLEFLPPDPKAETVLLRVYDFEDVRSGDITDKVSGGPQTRIRIPFSVFDQEDLASVKARLPKLTIVRKETPLTQKQWDRIRLDKTGMRIEMEGRVDADAIDRLYSRQRATLIESRDAGMKDVKFKTARLGIEGCCGRGCNGCMIFWNDPEFEKARELMARKKQGEMLERDARKMNIEESV